MPNDRLMIFMCAASLFVLVSATWSGTPQRSASHAVARRHAPADATSWLRYGYDVERTNENPAERTLGTGNVGGLKPLWSSALNGASMTQPLVVSGVPINGTRTQVVYAGDESGTL